MRPTEVTPAAASLQELGGTGGEDSHPDGGGEDRDQRQRFANRSPPPPPSPAPTGVQPPRLCRARFGCGLANCDWESVHLSLLRAFEGVERRAAGWSGVAGGAEGGGAFPLHLRHVTENALAMLEVEEKQDVSFL